MKLISWNVNGIRACLKKDFKEFFDEASADIFCIQETKAKDHDVSFETPNHIQYWNSAEKKGYSGTAVFTKTKPLNVFFGIDKNEKENTKKHNKEGRVITLEFEKFYLINCYTPNSQRGLTRLNYRIEWEIDFRNYLKNLEKKKPVILCGDLNVAHTEIDLKNPKSNKTTKTRPGNAGFTDSERNEMTKLLESGFIDSFRHINPKKIEAYTWWSYMHNARARNIGWRIDYFITSTKLKSKINNSKILPEILGSDHCPVILDIKL